MSTLTRTRPPTTPDQHLDLPRGWWVVLNTGPRGVIRGREHGFVVRADPAFGPDGPVLLGVGTVDDRGTGWVAWLDTVTGRPARIDHISPTEPFLGQGQQIDRPPHGVRLSYTVHPVTKEARAFRVQGVLAYRDADC